MVNIDIEIITIIKPGIIYISILDLWLWKKGFSNHTEMKIVLLSTGTVDKVLSTEFSKTQHNS